MTALLDTTNRQIICSGPTPGDQIRALVAANPAAGSVDQRTTVMYYRILVPAGATLTDSNAVWAFDQATGGGSGGSTTVNATFYMPTTGAGTLTLDDCMFIYQNAAKGAPQNDTGGQPNGQGILAGTVNFTNVVFAVQTNASSGVSSPFATSGITFNIDRFYVTSFGGSTQINIVLPNGSTQEGLILAQPSSNSLAIQLGGNSAVAVVTIDGLRLVGLSLINSSGTAGSIVEIFELDWDQTSWQFFNPGVNFRVVNPKPKPPSWSNYVKFLGGGSGFVHEFMTHDVKVQDSSSPLVGVNVCLYDLIDEDFEYTAISGASGITPQQRVQTYANIAGFTTFTPKNAVEQVVFSYGYLPFYAAKDFFPGPINDVVTITQDPAITETNAATVAAYDDITNLDELYDALNEYQFRNATNVLVPSYRQRLAEASGTRVVVPWEIVFEAFTSGPGIDVNVGREIITVQTSGFGAGTRFTELEVLASTITTAGLVDLEVILVESTNTRAPIVFTNVQPGTELRVFNNSGDAEIGTGIESSASSTEVIQYTHSGSNIDARAVAISLAYEVSTLPTVTLNAQRVTIPLNQQLDRQYENP